MEDKKIRNKIITISGEPVTGKGTNVKAIKQKLMEKGYEEDNIHIITTGHEFRRYFEVILDFIRNVNNQEKLNELSQNKEIKDIMDNPKFRPQFVKELTKLIKSDIDFSEQISIEQANNTEELKGIREIVDTLIDENVKKLGVEINSVERPNEVWIVDSRLAFSNIPESFAVRLTCKPEIAGQRLFNDSTRGKEDSEYKSVEDAIAQRERRKIGEINRYKERYNIDLSDETNYDLVIDTSYSTIDDISDTIIECLERYQENKFVPRNWTSPKMFIPTQSGRQTYFADVEGKNSLEEICSSIKEVGYNPEKYVEAVEVDGMLFINDAHHRCFAAAKAGKTLIPYEVIAKDNDIAFENYTARNIIKEIKISEVYNHEDIIGNGFRYKEIYPDLIERIGNKIKDDEER